MKKETEHQEESAAPEAVETSKSEASTTESKATNKGGGLRGKLQHLWNWVCMHKKISIPVAAVAVLLLAAAIPFTRYAVAGLFWKQDFTIVVTDTETDKPVSRAQVTLHGVSAFTDSAGKAKLHVPVGKTQLIVDKRYYKTVTQSVTVPIMQSGDTYKVSFQATGRQVPLAVTNKITKQVVKGVTIKAEGAEAQTDAKGEAVLVVPANKATVAAKLSGQGYNAVDVTVKVTTQADPSNAFTVTPAGKIYFLSNQSGKIDVVKTNLDGSERQVVLAGTGKENPNETSLLASQDWKYLALWSKRDGGDNAKIFLIDTTANDQITTMDEGNANFTPTGWDGHHFIYTVFRKSLQDWQTKRTALKSFDAESKKITLLDETTAQGSGPYDFLREDIGTVFILANGQIVYPKTWNSSYNMGNMAQLANKQATLNTINADGSNHKVVQSFSLAPGAQSTAVFISTHPYEANALYVQFSDSTKEIYYEYENNAVKEEKSITQEQFYGAYNTYLVSPSNNQTFWSESRDGKSTFFIGDQNGDHGKQIMTASKYNPFGWFTDDYLLVSKNGSELYIMSTAGAGNDDAALKVSDYYRPPVSFYGYGKGYGGY